MKQTAIILEDESLAANRLQRMIQKINPEIEITNIFESINDLVNHILSSETQADILFLDIHVADGNSFEIFRLANITSKVIFTTAYDEYAVQAFRQNALDYILKPIKEIELSQAIKKASTAPKTISLSGEENKLKNRFLIRFGNKLYSIKTEEIAYIYSKNKISYFVKNDHQKIASDYRLHELESMLDSNVFFRVNRQFIVHLESIESINRHSASRLKLSLNPAFKDDIIVSTEKTRSFKKWMDR